MGIQRTQSCARCPHLAEGGSVRARLLDVRPHLRYILHLRLTPFWPPLAENMFEIRRSTTRAGHVYKESRSSTIGALSVVSRYLPLFFRRVRNRWGGGSDVISVGGPPNVRPMGEVATERLGITRPVKGDVRSWPEAPVALQHRRAADIVVPRSEPASKVRARPV